MKRESGYLYLMITDDVPRTKSQWGVSWCELIPYYFKIGRSKNPEERLKQIQQRINGVLALVHTIPTNDMTFAERHLLEELHRERGAYLVKGNEWWFLGTRVLQWILNTESMMYEWWPR